MDTYSPPLATSAGSAPSAPAPSTPSSVKPLFRQQAVEHVTVRQYGTVILAQSLSLRFLTGLFVAIAVAIVTFFVVFSTTRKAQCQGVLLPTSGVLRVLPVQGGTVTEKRVREGQEVHAGDVLFVLTTERGSAAGDAQKAISALLENRRDSFKAELGQSRQQSQQRADALRRKIAELGTDQHRLDDQIALQQQRVTLAEQAYKRFTDLQSAHFISAAQAQDKQADLLDQRQRLNDLRRAKAAGQRDLDSTQADLNDLRVQGERDLAALNRNASAVQQDLTDNEARREIVVRSPQAGVVTAITAEAGQTVAAGQSIASILPAGSTLEAEIYAPSRSVGFVKPGMQVLLRYQAYPYEKFGQHPALVTEVASTSLRPEELALPGATMPAGSVSEPLYRIRLKLDKQTIKAYGKDMPLKSGMLVDASIVLDRRNLYEWVLEPLFSISGRM